MVSYPTWFGYQKEAFSQLAKSVKNKTPLIIISGMAGTGKTSLAKRLLDTHPGFYIGLQKYGDKKNLRRSYFLEQVKGGFPNLWVDRELESHIAKIRADYVEFFHKSNPEDVDLSSLFQALDNWAHYEEKQFLLIIDDASSLSRFQHLNFENLFAFIADNCPNITIILISEDEKYIRDACSLDDPRAPLFGRDCYSIHMDIIGEALMNRAIARSLESGGEALTPEEKKNVSTAVSQLPKSLESVSLFLNEFQDARPIGKAAIRSFFQKQSQKAHERFLDFLSNRIAKDKYEKIIRHLSGQARSWSQIKDKLELDLGERLYDKNFNELLVHLEKNGYLKKTGDRYALAKPLLGRYYASLDHG